MLKKRGHTMMKIFRMLGRSIRDAFKSVFRNFSLSLASISCITITLVIVALSVMASFNVENFTEVIESDLTIVAFMDNDSTTEDIENMKKTLDDMKNIDSYTYETKNEVKEEMAKDSEVFAAVMDGWTEEENPLRDTFQIKVKNIE